MAEDRIDWVIGGSPDDEPARQSGGDDPVPIARSAARVRSAGGVRRSDESEGFRRPASSRRRGWRSGRSSRGARRPASNASMLIPKCSSRKTTSFRVLMESRIPPVISGVRTRELVRVLAGEEFLEDEMVNDLGDIFHDGLVRLVQGGATSSRSDRAHGLTPVARSRPIPARWKLHARRISVNAQFPSSESQHPPKRWIGCASPPDPRAFGTSHRKRTTYVDSSTPVQYTHRETNVPTPPVDDTRPDDPIPDVGHPSQRNGEAAYP